MADLTTLAYVQGYMGNAGDAVAAAALPALISAASAFIENYCSRTFALTSYNEWYNGSGNALLNLANLPVVAVTSVQICGQTTPQSTQQNQCGWVQGPYGLNGRWLTFPKGSLNVKVSYSAGFAVIPDDLQQCVAIMCNIRYKLTPQEDKNSVAVMQQSTSFKSSELTPYVRQILSMYQPPLKIFSVPA